MPRATTFAELLEEQLHDVREAEPAPRPQAYRPAPVIGFFSFTPDLDVAEIKYTQHARASFTSVHGASAPRPEPRVEPRVEVKRPPQRPRRVLSPTEQRALDRLVDLGATIDASFTAEELRSAFRALARRYHPDRHPKASATERARLSSLFAQLRQAYTDLQPAVPAAA